MREEIIATIPQNGDAAALEVALLHDGTGSADVELRYLVWGSGLGWYRQNTLTLDSAGARALLRMLGVIQGRLKRAVADECYTNVIPFSRGRQGYATGDQSRPQDERGRLEAQSSASQR